MSAPGAMDFFDKQDRARRRTRWLIVYFALAVVGIVVTVQIVFALLLGHSILDPQLFVLVAGGVLGVVLLGSLIKTAELSQGGRVVAGMLGGEPVLANTRDPDERRLMNVIEEMSLASGVPVPEVFVLPEQSINAFAAGHGPGDTAIGVTRGCIRRLTRDELQGVIAHEFSHILHGDMRLNIRLMGLLAGIMGLSMIGRLCFEAARFMPLSSGRRDQKDGSGGLVLVILAGGAALFLIGWIGVFFGNLIKAAVSRQREFLADASAVQYTRNPQGIAGALWKIGKFQSRLESPRAQEASHMFFGNGVGDPWLALFATHPPLDERIRAIDPGFQPGPLTEPPAETVPEPPPPRSAGLPGMPGMIGGILASLPAFASESVRDLHGACAFVYALLLDERDDVREVQLAALRVEPALREETLALYGRRAEIAVTHKLPLVDLVIPTLRHLSPAQYAEFRGNVTRLVESDREIQLFEYALQKTLVRHLDLSFTRSTGARVRFRSVVALLPEIAVLLTGIAQADHADPALRDAAFSAGVRELLINQKPEIVAGCNLSQIDAALDRIAEASPDVKRMILKACSATSAHDGVVGIEEYELLRAIADTLDCPLPPHIA